LSMRMEKQSLFVELKHTNNSNSFPIANQDANLP
jgi:hypothetical protein